ncbi:MAG TPA: hypothetical protein VGO93_21270 [Candidatus Xenobia bacterium]|jgi:dipeptidyl aminopeptidase/acylaminoacyl peptidase
MHWVWRSIGLVLLMAASTLARPLEPAQVIDALEPGWRMPMAVRSDGREVAYCVMQPSRQQDMLEEDSYRSRTGVFAESIGNDIWLADAGSASVRNLTSGHGTSFAPVWSPDGSRLAFVSDRDGSARLWMWSQGRLRRVCPEVVWLGVGWERPVWTPDGRSLIVKLLPRGLSIREAARRENPPRPGTGAENDRRQPVHVYDAQTPEAETLASRTAAADLSLVEVSSGQVRRLAAHAFTSGWWVSPDGRHVAYTEYRGQISPTSQSGSFDLDVIDLQSGRARRLMSGFASDFGTGVTWSPDSRQVACFTQPVVNDYHETEVMCAEVGGSVRQLTRGQYFQETQGPIWLDDQHLLLRSPDQLLRCSTDGITSSLVA